MAQRAKLIPVLSFCAILITAFWAAREKSIEAQITQCLDGCFCQPDLSYLPEVLDELVRSTRYEGRYEINGQPRKQILNVYFICRSPSSPLKALRGGCFYVPASTAIIVCDLSFIDEYYLYFRTAVDPHDLIFARSLDSFAKPLMLNWFLGHEIGHAVKSPVSGHFAFDGKEARCSDLRFDKQRELEADSFVVEQGLKEKVEAGNSKIEAVRLFALTSILWAIIDKEADRYSLTSLPEGPAHIPIWLKTETVNVPDESCSHPPMIIRAVRLLDAITRHVELAKEQRSRVENTMHRITYLGVHP